MTANWNALTFHVHRRDAVRVSPAEPTPYEFKRLSDIDDQQGLRIYLPVIQFYRHSPSMKDQDPSSIIRHALAKALVPYYPIAGRLREVQDGSRRLVVECTGEDALFVEAYADVRIEQFGDLLCAPFQFFEKLLVDIPRSGDTINLPLLLVQVTRLQCGGFIFGMRLHHAMTDASGLIQFMTAVAEMARGCVAPSVLPIWSRELFKARIPPRPSFLHRTYDEDVEKEATTNTSLDHDMVHYSFFFGPCQIATLRSNIPPHLRNKASTFDILTACLWKCRTIALSVDPDQEMHMIFAVNARVPKRGLNIPKGYYGNAVAYVAAVSNADDLCLNPLGHPLDLILKAKAEVNCEYMQSVADFMILQRRPHFKMARSYIVSDLTNAKFEDVDFGWGKAIYGGLADGGAGCNPAVVSVYISFTNAKGEKGIAVPVCLPGPAMEKFVIELEKIIRKPSLPLAIRSTL